MNQARGQRWCSWMATTFSNLRPLPTASCAHRTPCRHCCLSVRYGARPMSFGNWTTVNKRLRDYTATQMKTEPESGRANAFVAFLADTLLPELAQRYPVQSAACGLAGIPLVRSR